MNINIKYIIENFIEQEELCEISEISRTELKLLIEKELLPNPSYTIRETYKITSPLDDENVIVVNKEYFAKSTIQLIKENKNLKAPSDFKEKMRAEFTETFLNNQDNKFAYDDLSKENGEIDLKSLDTAFEEEWKYFLQGIYGICTLNGTAAEIAKKEIVVKKAIAFNKKYDLRKLSEREKGDLVKLNDQFNEVTHTFAPYQRATSSRGKYLDKALELNSLSVLKKKY